MAIRETIRSLETSPGRLQLFRQAFSRMMSLGDDRGYQWFASIHALPLPGWCEHGTYLFLPWHRAYLFYFELALQTRLGPRFTQRDPAEAAFADVAVPWWDWTSDESHRNGLPASYDAATVAGASNPLQSSGVASCQGGDRIALGVWSNALVSSLRNSNDPDPRTRRALRGLLTPTGDPRTRRDPDEPDELPRKNTIDNVVLQEPTFETFSDSLEQVHGDVHVECVVGVEVRDLTA
ncbi:MAG: tyrosinase family protein [Planctomycetes bacterium]|nr:tyrosinase family protein [Planctomycetota bacterium]